VGALFAQCAQVNRGPGAEGPPHLRQDGETVVGAVPDGELVLEPAVVQGDDVQRVGAADNDDQARSWMVSAYPSGSRKVNIRPNGPSAGDDTIGTPVAAS
jgi:hypothetical protein